MFVTVADFLGIFGVSMDQEKVWEEILLLIENRMSKQGYDTWFSSSKLLSIDDNKLLIEVPSKFHRDWIKEHHWATLSEVIREVTKKPDMEIDFFVPPQQLKKAVRLTKEEKKESATLKKSIPSTPLWSDPATSSLTPRPRRWPMRPAGRIILFSSTAASASARPTW
jgi:chromosomal replication initiation ATPase DnaA